MAQKRTTEQNEAQPEQRDKVDVPTHPTYQQPSPVLLEALYRLSGRRYAEEGIDVLTIYIGVPLAEGGEERVRITPREREALQLAADGLSTTEIAQAMCITLQAVYNLFGRLYRKLGVPNRTAAVTFALRHRLVE